MSDTPRTDAGEYWKIEDEAWGQETWVPIEFARQIERELNEAKQQRDQWREVAFRLFAEHPVSKETLAAFEALEKEIHE